jgi:Ca2+-transporting ATPase
METELGKIARNIEEAKEPEIPLQKKMSQLARTLSLFLLTLIFILTLIQIVRLYLRGDLHTDSVMEQLVNAVILSVVAVPWSFPIITTTTMARGMLHLVKENAIIRRIASVEGLGRVSVICSDKTGTMTENAMTVRTIYLDGNEYRITGSGYDPGGSIFLNGEEVILEEGSFLHRLILSAFLNNNARLSSEKEQWSIIGDPTEGALKTLGEKAGLDKDLKDLEKMRELPFDSDRKMMSSIFREKTGFAVYSKGSLESILERSDSLVKNGGIEPLTDEMRAELIQANAGISGRAERTLAVAYKNIPGDPSSLRNPDDDEIESGLIFLGIVGMMDPPKRGVREAVEKCRTAGIKVVMITGDSRETASAIARDLGVLEEGGRVVNGSELPLEREVLRDVSVFCRVSPGQKVDIVNEYRKMHKIIAMTGDGMNDAAALKNADVGVAMGRSGVDVAKEASQIVLADDNFATLVTAVHRGRQIFDNIQKSITYQIYTNLSEVAIMFLGSLLFLEQMMSDRQLLFLYFSTHIFPVAALVLDRTTQSVMREPPRDVKEGIISRKVLGRLGVMITTMAVFALSAYYLLDMEILDLASGSDKLETIQTMILTFVVSAECINLFNSLSMKDSLIKQVSERNLILPILMALIPIGALTILMYHLDLGETVDLVRLTPVQFVISAASGLVIIPVVEAFKILARRAEIIKV